MRRVIVLGSTGSIGTSTLDVVARHPDRFEVFALTAASRVDELLQQCLRYTPRFAVMVDAARAADLAQRLATHPRSGSGHGHRISHKPATRCQ